jgi:hypothetical protein
MTAREIIKLDDDTERAMVAEAAKAGNDQAATKLFLWAQWHKINHTQGFRPAKKIALLGQMIDCVLKEVRLEFTRG